MCAYKKQPSKALSVSLNHFKTVTPASDPC